jgi:hypothetical protein
VNGRVRDTCTFTCTCTVGRARRWIRGAGVSVRAILPPVKHSARTATVHVHVNVHVHVRSNPFNLLPQRIELLETCFAQHETTFAGQGFQRGEAGREFEVCLL